MFEIFEFLKGVQSYNWELNVAGLKEVDKNCYVSRISKQLFYSIHLAMDG
jgi:hypothetical protein